MKGMQIERTIVSHSLQVGIFCTIKPQYVMNANERYANKEDDC